MDTPERNTENAAPKRRLNSSIVAAGVAFGITLAGLGVAAAQTDGADGTTATTAAPSGTTAGSVPSTDSTAEPGATAPTAGIEEGGRRHGGAHDGRPGGAPAGLTGEAADEVTSAALVAVPGGTIVRVQAGPEGGYHAHVTKGDGSEVVVTLDAEFTVTGTVDADTFGGCRHHGPKAADTDSETD